MSARFFIGARVEFVCDVSFLEEAIAAGGADFTRFADSLRGLRGTIVGIHQDVASVEMDELNEPMRHIGWSMADLKLLDRPPNLHDHEALERWLS